MKLPSSIIMSCVGFAVVIAPVSVPLAQETNEKTADTVETKNDVVLLNNAKHIRSQAY
jgi:hypothetical protein